MHNCKISHHCKNWEEEFDTSLSQSNSLCIGIFSLDKELIFANNIMASFLKKEVAHENIMNPSFEHLLNLNSDTSLIYDGYLTIGDSVSGNLSITAKVYKKNGQLLIIGDFNVMQLLEQNKAMHHLNGEINNLQRELIKDKFTLQDALNQLSKANNELKHINATKDKLFSIIAHDLKSPFQSILGLSDILANVDESSDLDCNKYIKLINDQAKATLNLLDNLLNWARLQTGQIHFVPEKLKLSDLIWDVLYVLKPSAVIKDIEIAYKSIDNFEVWADLNMLKTILINLISNAIKFTYPNGRVTIETLIHKNEIEISVSDNGVGMDKKTICSLFKVDKSTTKLGTHNEKGTGLGLILCKEFVEKQGGEIWIESKTGNGSDFKFTIPRFSNNILTNNVSKQLLPSHISNSNTKNQ